MDDISSCLAFRRVEFWRLKTVCRVVELSKSEIYRRMANGHFPKSRSYPGTNKKFWVSGEVRRWQETLLGTSYSELLG